MSTANTTTNSPVFLPSQVLVQPPSLMLGTSEKPKNRCNHADCKVKLLLSDMACKCGSRFCGKHRYAEEHRCSFDYRQSAAKNLSTSLVKCVATSLKQTI
uniref:AN1-type domain-containing protein n=1 Tax=viral metagenome TaxID=1070528 RepID=A0A6C0LQ20_9ZZZZ